MTVKATLAYGKNFHFYHEGLDNNHVYLELEEVSYDAGYRRLMVAIPIDIWEVIRGLGAANLDLVDASDEELIKTVEGKVAERLALYEETKASSPEEARWLKFSDSAVFGPMDAPQEQQITKGIEYYRTERERQREISIRIRQHKIMDINTTNPEVKQDI